MKSKTLVLLAVSGGCGLVAALLVGRLVQPPEANKIEVVVASREVPRGTPLKSPEQYFKLQAVPRDAVPATALTSLDQLANQVAQRTFDPGQVCTSRDVGRDDSLGHELPLGSLALAVRVTLDSSVAGFVVPGAHVDLICTVPDPKNKGQRLAKIFMQDVLVLAVNQIKENQDRSAPIGNPTVVTVAVKPDQAERLVWVKESAPVTLALRKTGDPSMPETPGASGAFAPQEPTTVLVPVARQRIEPGTALNSGNVPEFFELQPQLARSLPRGTITQMDQLQGRTVHRFLAAGLCCTEDNLSGSQVQRTTVLQHITNGTNTVKTEFSSVLSAVPEPDFE